MVAATGFEPILNEPESFVLPLHHAAIGSSGRTRTCDLVINSHSIYQLIYAGIFVSSGSGPNTVSSPSTLAALS